MFHSLRIMRLETRQMLADQGPWVTTKWQPSSREQNIVVWHLTPTGLRKFCKGGGTSTLQVTSQTHTWKNFLPHLFWQKNRWLSELSFRSATGLCLFTSPPPAAFGFMIPVFPSCRVWKLHEYYNTLCTYYRLFLEFQSPARTNWPNLSEEQRTLILTRFSFTPSYRRSSARFTLHYGIRRSHPRFLTWAVFPAVLATLLCDKAAIISDL